MQNTKKIKLKCRGDRAITVIARAARPSDARLTAIGQPLQEFIDQPKNAPTGISRSAELPGEGFAGGVYMQNTIASLLLKTPQSSPAPRARRLTGNRLNTAAVFAVTVCPFSAVNAPDSPAAQRRNWVPGGDY